MKEGGRTRTITYCHINNIIGNSSDIIILIYFHCMFCVFCVMLFSREYFYHQSLKRRRVYAFQCVKLSYHTMRALCLQISSNSLWSDIFSRKCHGGGSLPVQWLMIPRIDETGSTCVCISRRAVSHWQSRWWNIKPCHSCSSLMFPYPTEACVIPDSGVL